MQPDTATAPEDQETDANLFGAADQTEEALTEQEPADETAEPTDETPAPIEDATAEEQHDKDRELLNAYRTNKDEMRAVAEELARLQSDEDDYKNRLRSIRKLIEKQTTRLADLARAEAGQLSLLDGLDDDEKPISGHLTPWEQGHQAWAKNQGEGDLNELCPFDDDMPEQREKWLSGWEAAESNTAEPWTGVNDRARTWAQLCEASVIDHDADPQEVVDSYAMPSLDGQEKGKPIKVLPLGAWLTQFLVTVDESNDALFVLVPIYDLDTWKNHYAESTGEAWKTGKRNHEAPSAMEHGELCGLTVKEGRKHYVIGSLVDSIRIIANPDVASDGDDEGEDLDGLLDA